MSEPIRCPLCGGDHLGATAHSSDELRAWEAEHRPKIIERVQAQAADLDAAWAEAEAAMPKCWRFSISPYYPSGWEAEAHNIARVYKPGRGKHGTGTTGPYDTPAAALRALAAALSTGDET